MAQLLALLNHPLLTAVATPVRVLLLARPAGTWWAVLSYRLGRLGITAEAHELAPLAGRRAIPALYAHARDRFAELLDVHGCESIQPPDLSSEDYELILAVHMAALVAVDARLRGREVPAEPARLSAYLLDRERAAWRTLPPENQRPRSVARALVHGSPGPAELRGLALALMDYIWTRCEADRDLPEALGKLDEVERLLRLKPGDGRPVRYGVTSLVSVLELRATLLAKVGREEEAAQAGLAAFAEKRAADGFGKAIDPKRSLAKRTSPLADMVELEHPQGAEALALRAIAAGYGTAERDLALRLLRTWRRRERRRHAKDRLPTIRGPHGQAQEAASTAALLADIAAAEAADPAASVVARRNKAAELIALGDPRGAGILISQILDHELTPFNRLEAARELSDAGDPRAPYLTADLCAQLVTNRRVNRLLRGAAWSRLDKADPALAAEMRAARSARQTAPPDLRPIGWPVTAPPVAAEVLRDLSPRGAEALEQMPMAQLPVRSPPEIRKRRVLRARVLGVILAPLPAAIAFVLGAAITAIGGSHAGLGNWAALLVSGCVLGYLSWCLIWWIARLLAETFSVSPDSKLRIFTAYLLLATFAALIAGPVGFWLAHSGPGMARTVGLVLWDVLIWR